MRITRILSIVCLLWAGMASGTFAQTTASNTVNILYDGSGQYGWIGGLYARMLANLTGHFDLSYQITPVENYTAGMVDQARATFYFGSVYDNQLPAAFKTDVMATTNTVCWFRYNLWQIDDANFDAQTGFHFNWLDWSGYSNIVYKGESLLKNQLDPELGYVSVLDPNLASVSATAEKADGSSIPYIVHGGHFWYVADVPFVYISEEDRYLAFCDVLHDILGIDHPASKSAIVRIEDVAPTMYTSQELRQTADTLRDQNVPFVIALVPFFRDPLGYYNGVPEFHQMADSSDPASVTFVSDIHYMLTNNAQLNPQQLLIHGYTHQYDDVINPYTGVSGDDFEFWRETFSDPTTFTIDIFAPVAEDSPQWVMDRINSAKSQFQQLGLQHVGWEYPHYSASALDYAITATNFPLAMHRCLYFDDGGHVAGQFFPYPVSRDIYGQKLYPENLGNIEPQPWANYPARLPADIIRAARKNLVVRDGWAAFYFHPFFNQNLLNQTVTGIKNLGYTFVPLPEPPPAGQPPFITVQPQSQSVPAGTDVTFTVTAGGTAPLHYRWQWEGKNLGGGTAATLVINNVQWYDVGNYTVIITNDYGSITSAVAHLDVASIPIITQQPKSRTKTIGSSVTFSAWAEGSAPLNYQWKFNGNNIPGATNDWVDVNNIQLTDAGDYTVVVTNAYGSATSDTATLTVTAAPIITEQPQSQTVLAGATATFNVTATGTTPLAYQWRFNNTDLSGANTDSLTINNVQAVNTGNYTVVVTNIYGAVTSSVATLSLATAPAITGQPQSRTNTVGTTATFSVTATGTTPLAYQWRFNGSPLAGQTSVTLTLNNVQSANAGNYSVVVTNNYGAVTSSTAVLTVVAAPAITAQPQGSTNLVGSSVSFSVTATGTAPLSYQWRKDGGNIAGATSSTLNLANVQTSSSGNYSVVVSNAYGTVTSANATLLVGVAPAITTQPQSQTVKRNSSVTFSVVATGTAPISYQWRKDGSNISGATSSSYTISSVKKPNAGKYSVVVRNSFGSVTSANATLTIK